MKKILIILLVIVLLILSFNIISSLNSTFHADELWQKAQELAGNSYTLVPGKRTIIIETVTDGDTAAAESTTTAYSFHLGDNGEIVTEQISTPVSFDLSALDFDISEHLGDIQSGSNVKILTLTSMDDLPDFVDMENVQMFSMHSDSVSFDLTPSRTGIFFEEDRHKLTLRKMRGTKEIDGINVSGYAFKYSITGQKSDRTKGVVWLNSETGAPVMQEISSTGLSMTGSTDTVKHFGFKTDTNQFFVEKEIEIMSISVPLVGININITTTTIDEEHWNY